MILREEQIAGLTVAPVPGWPYAVTLAMPHPDDPENERPVECYLGEQDIRHLRDLLTEALDD